MLLDARSRMETEAASIAGPTDIARMKPKSGVFVAVSIALGRTGVYVGNYGEVTDSTASVVSTGGTVRAEADSLIRNRTYAISSPISVYVDEYGNPTFTQQPTQKQSLRSTVTLAETVLGARSVGTSGAPAWAVSKVTGSNSLGSVFNKGAAAEYDPADDIASTQVMGALALAVVDNDILARIATGGAVSAEKGGVQLHAFGETDSRIRADGSLYNNATLAVIPGIGKVQITKDATNTSAGVAITVAVTTHNAAARIEKGVITAGKALPPPWKTAGWTPPPWPNPATSRRLRPPCWRRGDRACDHPELQSRARARRRIPAGRGAGLTVLSRVADSRLETVADASGKRSRHSLGMFPIEPEKSYSTSSVGVGAGIAVAVTGIDVVACVPDGVVFLKLDGTRPDDAALGNVTVDSYYMGSERCSRRQVPPAAPPPPPYPPPACPVCMSFPSWAKPAARAWTPRATWSSPPRTA